jgi:hypothetical protein
VKVGPGRGNGMDVAKNFDTVVEYKGKMIVINL